MKTRRNILAGAAAGPAAATLVASAGLTGASARAAVATSVVKPVQDCLLPPATCYSPAHFRTAYGIQSLLDHGIDGRGKTVALIELSTSPPAQFPPVTNIRQDLARFDSVFRLPAAKIQVDNSPLRHASTEADAISISVSLGEHFFTRGEAASLHQALERARARHVTVVAATGDFGASSDPAFDEGPVKEVSLPASDPPLRGPDLGGGCVMRDPRSAQASHHLPASVTAPAFRPDPRREGR